MFGLKELPYLDVVRKFFLGIVLGLSKQRKARKTSKEVHFAKRVRIVVS